MLTHNEKEEIIRLMYKGYDIELLSFELEIPIEDLLILQQELNFRKNVYNSIHENNWYEAQKLLNEYISDNDDIISRAMLLKVDAYINKSDIDKKELTLLDEEQKKIGLNGAC
jgi:hypothetical protein